MTEQEIELKARLLVIENFLQMLMLAKYRDDGLSTGEITALHKQLLLQAKRETFPNVGPALSDHVAAVYEQHVSNLLTGIEQKLAAQTG